MREKHPNPIAKPLLGLSKKIMDGHGKIEISLQLEAQKEALCGIIG